MLRSIFKLTGLGEKDFIGYQQDGQEELVEWKIKGGKARYPKSKQAKINRKRKDRDGFKFNTDPAKIRSEPS